MKKALLIFAAIILGGVFNFGHEYTFMIRYNLMAMLFFAFLGIKMDLSLFNKNHFKVLLINILLPILFYSILQPFNQELALTAFVLTVIPTAAAAPVIAPMLKANIGEVTVAVILTTPIIAILLPFLMTYFLGLDGKIPLQQLILPVMSIVFLPLFLSQAIRLIDSRIWEGCMRLGFLMFPLFIINVFIACGNASHFVQSSSSFSRQDLVIMLLMAAILCILQFQIGKFIGRNSSRYTYEIAMGRKNTMIGLWLALTYFSPVVALGPICYILMHNAYNSMQIWQLER